MRVFLILVLVVVFSSCVRNKNGQVGQVTTQNQAVKPSAANNTFKVKEVIQTSSYTYMFVSENQVDKWVAISKQDVKVGDVLHYDEALEMTNFESKELERTFDVIYFINKATLASSGQNGMGANPSMGQPKMDLGAMHKGKQETGNAEVAMEKAEDELTIKDIFSNTQKYANEEFEIKGVAVKVVREVMGKNWIHIQDGTSFNGKFDLTITTKEEIEPNSNVIFKGKLTLKKDFGYGYYYDVIMEDATPMVHLNL